MNPCPTPHRRRERFVTITLIILIGGGIFLYLLLSSGLWFLAFLGTLAAVVLIGLFHYILWGRSSHRHDREDLFQQEAPEPWEEPSDVHR